jgi:hypothetical protein
MRSPEYLRKQARKCRRLAAQLTNTPVADRLLELASEYENEAGAFGCQQQSQDTNESDSDRQQS